MATRRNGRIYWRDQGGERRAYADFRDYADVGGGREALTPKREKRATTDPDVAQAWPPPGSPTWRSEGGTSRSSGTRGRPRSGRMLATIWLIDRYASVPPSEQGTAVDRAEVPGAI